ncbi:MAG: GNAT family N-acetyltransferase [Blastocatellia bacterium]
MIRPAAGKRDIETARELFIEYSQTLGIDLCFQGFAAELAGLPGDYAPPGGCLLLAETADGAIGCVALRRLDEDSCEMKRLYLRPQHRGAGAGLALTQAVIAESRRMGYARLRLDTLPSMRKAQALYRALGFVEIPPYDNNPVPGALFMELDLTRA